MTRADLLTKIVAEMEGKALSEEATRARLSFVDGFVTGFLAVRILRKRPHLTELEAARIAAAMDPISKVSAQEVRRAIENKKVKYVTAHFTF